MPVHMNLIYDMRGPKPRWKEGPVVGQHQIQRRTVSVWAGLWPLHLPGTCLFSVQLQVTSSTQTSSISVLVAMEQPGEPTAVVFGGPETSSATASSPTGVIAHSQEEIRSIGSYTKQPTAGRKLPPQSGLPLYRQPALVTCQVRVKQKPQHMREKVNNTLVTLSCWIHARALEGMGPGTHAGERVSIIFDISWGEASPCRNAGWKCYKRACGEISVITLKVSAVSL